MKKPVSIRDIAAHSGFSKSAVSLALRNHPSLPQETIKRIQDFATKLDYRPNPMVTSLMSTLRARKPGSRRPTLAYLTAFPTEMGWKHNRSFEKYFIGAQARARELGYNFQLSWLREPGMTDERLDKILRARGITGLIFAPAPTRTEIQLTWHSYAMAKIGFSLASFPIHTAANHQTRTILELLRNLTEAGLKRIGLVISEIDDIRVENSWSAGHFIHTRHAGEEEAVPPLVVPLNRKVLLKWLRTHRPEAIITARADILDWLQEAKMEVPKDIALASLDVHAEQNMAGMDQRSESIGAAAVDLVVEQLNNNERGIPEYAKTVLIEGKWLPGRTVARPGRSAVP